MEEIKKGKFVLNDEDLENVTGGNNEEEVVLGHKELEDPEAGEDCILQWMLDPIRPLE